MCEPKDPVKDVVSRLSADQLQSVIYTALRRSEKARGAGDEHMANAFQKVADGAARELDDRLLTEATRAVVRESQQFR